MYPDQAVRKVLIYRTGSLGDTVVALPCFHQIARAFPSAERVLLTDIPVRQKAPTAMAVLSGTGLVHRDMRYPGATRKVGEILSTLREIRRYRPNVLVHLMPRGSLKEMRRDQIFFRLAGVRRIVGLGTEVPVHRCDPATGMYEAQASLLARSIAELGDADVENPENWSLHLSPDEQEKARRALAPLAGRPLMVCGPGTKRQANDWGQENWRALLGRLSERYPSYALATLGAKEETEYCEYAAQEWAGPKLNLAGRLNPRESAAVIGHAVAFLGHDSGPMHLAASVGVPSVVVFSARNKPGVWFPFGRKNQVIYHRTDCMTCGLETCVEMGKKCILSVTVGEMERAVDAVLRPIASPATVAL
ncbi:MAG: glycosyltransferase family 9 protein [Terracidiphilus sp.]